MSAKFISRLAPELPGDISNPWRGYYDMRRLDLAKPEHADYPPGGLVLLEAKLPREPLAASHISALARELESIGAAKRGCILRLLYDWDGECWKTEPDDADDIIAHIKSLGAVLRERGDILFAHQGLLVGNWGEMHGSRHIIPDKLREIAEHVRAALPDECYMAVRRPMYRKMLEDMPNIGLYNDAMLSSDDDMGTFRLDYERALGDEMAKYAPCGGETAAIYGDNTTDAVITALRARGATYLSAAHCPDVVNSWRESGLYARVGALLGYRFVISRLTCAFGVMKFVVENVGFARLYRKSDVKLVIGDTKIELGERADMWLPAEKRMIRVNLPKLSRGEYPVALNIEGGIAFANASGNQLGILKYK